jgi:hypothetical protein
MGFEKGVAAWFHPARRIAPGKPMPEMFLKGLVRFSLAKAPVRKMLSFV